MYICICNSVTDKAIRQEAANGVRSLVELTRRTGCSGTCGSCTELAEQVLHDAVRDMAFPLPVIRIA